MFMYIDMTLPKVGDFYNWGIGLWENFVFIVVSNKKVISVNIKNVDTIMHKFQLKQGLSIYSLV